MGLFSLYFKAFAFGVAVAAPVGPMGLLCMRRTLVQGWKYGLVTALGIAVSDGIYSGVAALGLTGISDFILSHKPVFHLLAGLFFAGFGIKAFFTKAEPMIAKAENIPISMHYALGSSILMTLSNPLILLFFISGFAALTPESGFNSLSGGVTIVGVFTGSLIWSAQIVASVSFLRHSINQDKQMLIGKVIGVLLLIFGVWEIGRYFSG